MEGGKDVTSKINSSINFGHSECFETKFSPKTLSNKKRVKLLQLKDIKL
jgi:hypothetical protein